MHLALCGNYSQLLSQIHTELNAICSMVHCFPCLAAHSSRLTSNMVLQMPQSINEPSQQITTLKHRAKVHLSFTRRGRTSLKHFPLLSLCSLSPSFEKQLFGYNWQRKTNNCHASNMTFFWLNWKAAAEDLRDAVTGAEHAACKCGLRWGRSSRHCEWHNNIKNMSRQSMSWPRQPGHAAEQTAGEGVAEISTLQMLQQLSQSPTSTTLLTWKAVRENKRTKQEERKSGRRGDSRALEKVCE